MNAHTKPPVPPAFPIRIAEMEPAQARQILRRCDRADQAILEVDNAIETGQIYGAVGTIVYPTRPGEPFGKNARLRASHWKRIVQAKLQDDFWDKGQVDLPAFGESDAVNLRCIRLNGGDVRAFAAPFNRNSEIRVDAEVIGHLPQLDHTIACARPDKEASWDLFWLEVVDLASKGYLSRGYYRSQAALASEIMDRIGPKLSKNTIDPKVSLIWSRIVDPQT